MIIQPISFRPDQGQAAKNLPFSPEIVFDASVVIYSRVTTPNTLTLTANLSGAIPGSVAVIELVATGGTAPNFSAFKALNGSSGWDNRSGIINLVMVYYFGPDSIWVTIAQEEGQVPIDIVAPTLVSAVIPNDAPNTVVLTFSEALATRATPSTSFTVSGKTVTGFAQSGSTVTLTVSTPFVFGDAATLSYTPPGANPLADAAGNQVAAISGINVALPSLLLSFPAGNRTNIVVGGTPALPTYTPVGGTAIWAATMLSDLSLPANTDGEIRWRQLSQGQPVVMGFRTSNTNGPHTSLSFGLLASSATTAYTVMPASIALPVNWQAGDWMIVRRVGGVVTLAYERAGTTTTIHTFAGTNNAQLWISAYPVVGSSVASEMYGVGVAA